MIATCSSTLLVGTEPVSKFSKVSATTLNCQLGRCIEIWNRISAWRLPIRGTAPDQFQCTSHFLHRLWSEPNHPPAIPKYLRWLPDGYHCWTSWFPKYLTVSNRDYVCWDVKPIRHWPVFRWSEELLMNHHLSPYPSMKAEDHSCFATLSSLMIFAARSNSVSANRIHRPDILRDPGGLWITMTLRGMIRLASTSHHR